MCYITYLPTSELIMQLDGLPDDFKPSMETHRRLLDHALVMRTMTPQMVALYLDKHLPDIEGYDRIWTIKHYAGTRSRKHRQPKPQDSLFAAAVFMAGVSLGDLAMLFGIRKQTAAQKVHKHTTPEDRATMRDAPPMVDLEALALAKTIFDDAIAQGIEYEGIAPLEIGRGLLRAAHALIAEDRGTLEIPDRPRRYANMNISTPTPAETHEIVDTAGPVEPAETVDSSPPPVDIPAATEHIEPAPPVRPEEQNALNNLFGG